MSLLGNAAVTIWHDVPIAARADYFEWHNREHMAERVGIPGFLRGRRYVALHGAPEFCTLYEAQSLDVLTGPDYLARLENPSAMTRRVAPQLYGNVRSLCRVALTLGSGQGGMLMTWRYDVASEQGAAHRALVETALRALAARPGIVGAHLCLGDMEASAVQTAEKKSRPNKALTPNWVVLVEGGGERKALEDACAELLPAALLSGAGAHDLATGLYQLQFQPA
ncbi:MAG: hypothetical protein WCR74_07960 [Betaproteobacteria bacterium]